MWSVTPCCSPLSSSPVPQYSRVLLLAATSLLFRQVVAGDCYCTHDTGGACTWRPLSHFGRTPSVEHTSWTLGVTVLGMALTLPQLFSL